MNLSAIVVSFNEERRLRDCLQSLNRINDVIVIDIGSTDHSVDIARDLGFKVMEHPWIPIVEMILPSTMPLMKNDWIIRVDPDEVLPSNLIVDLMNLEVNDTVAIIQVPYQYYFLNKRLDTTIWGHVRPIPRVVNRNRISITTDVHRALNCKPGYETYTLPSRPGNAVIHYWVDTYQQLITKHKRYIAMEGESRYNSGFRFTWKSFFYNPLRSFAASFFKYAGWRGGWAGWFLSFFIAGYEVCSILSLKEHEKMLKDRVRS